jgi:hypothetical protein
MKRVITITLVLSILLSVSGPTAIAAKGAEKFTDVKAGAWFYPYVDSLTKAGVISGVTETAFAPSREINGAELITLILRSAGNFRPTGTAATEHWAQEYMERAYEIGLTSPEEFPQHQWSEPLSRQRMAVVVARSMEIILGETPAANADSFIGKIADWEDVCVFCKPYVAQAYAKGILVGTGKGFAPRNTTTRAEATVVIVKLLDKNYRTTWYDGIPFSPATDINKDGTMSMAAAERFIMKTLEQTRFYKENGKYYITSKYPASLPKGFEIFFSFGMERTNAPIIIYKTNAILTDDRIPNTGSFNRELVGLTSLNEIKSVILGISVAAPNATIDDYRKFEGMLGLQARFTSGTITLWDMWIDFTARGNRKLTYDRNKLFQWGGA